LGWLEAFEFSFCRERSTSSDVLFWYQDLNDDLLEFFASPHTLSLFRVYATEVSAYITQQKTQQQKTQPLQQHQQQQHPADTSSCRGCMSLFINTMLEAAREENNELYVHVFYGMPSSGHSRLSLHALSMCPLMQGPQCVKLLWPILTQADTLLQQKVSRKANVF
jgi:hypothetical protein